MIGFWAGSTVREAEAASIARAAERADPDRFMRAAAHGIATLVLRHLGPLGLGAPLVQGPTPRRAAVGALAGSGVAGRRIVALIGPGNNGGDGLYALAELARRGAACTALLAADRHHHSGAAAVRAAGGRVLALESVSGARALGRAEVVLDAVLGTGARGGFDLPPVPERAWRIACDVPSGLSADDGTAGEGTTAADTTIALGAPSLGLLLGRGRELCGEVHLVELPGLLDRRVLGDPAVELLTPALAFDSVLSPGPADHKYNRGVLGLVAGSPAYPGAALLSAHAALTTGVGMLTAFSRGTARMQFVAAVPEAVVTARSQAPDGAAAARVGTWLVGPGLGDEPEDLDAARRVLGTQRPAVIDASALAVVEPPSDGISGGPARASRLLTPHAGELAALGRRLGLELPDPRERPLDAVRAAAAALGSVVLLKGSCTLVATPSGRVLAAASAGPGLAIAGSGDTLAGIAAALLCTHAARAARDGGSLDDDAVARLGAAAAVLHGLAGEHATHDGSGAAAALAGGLAALLDGR